MTTSKITTEDEFDDLRFRTMNVTDSKDGITVLENEYIDSSRWFEIWRLVWSEDNGSSYYAYLYQIPATEVQEGSEDEFDPAGIVEVKPKETVIIEYVEVGK